METYMIFSSLGMAAMVIGGIALIVQGFRVSLGWGFGSLLVPGVSIVFLFKHWGMARIPFGVYLIGLASFGLAIYMQSLLQ